MSVKKGQRNRMFAGLFGRKKKSGRKAIAKTKSPEIRQGRRRKGDSLYRVCYAYANSMGNKFALTEQEIAQNARKHYRQARRDSVFRDFLYREYNQV